MSIVSFSQLLSYQLVCHLPWSVCRSIVLLVCVLAWMCMCIFVCMRVRLSLNVCVLCWMHVEASLHVNPGSDQNRSLTGSSGTALGHWTTTSQKGRWACRITLETMGWQVSHNTCFSLWIQTLTKCFHKIHLMFLYINICLDNYIRGKVLELCPLFCLKCQHRALDMTSALLFSKWTQSFAGKQPWPRQNFQMVHMCVLLYIFHEEPHVQYICVRGHTIGFGVATLMQSKATSSPVIWFELFLTSWLFSLSLHITASVWARGTLLGPLPTSSHETLPGLSLLLPGHGYTRLGPGSLAPGLPRLQSLTPSSPSPPCWSFLPQFPLYIITQLYIRLCAPRWVHS